MEDQIEDALFADDNVQSSLQVSNGLGIVGPVKILCLPIGRNHARKLPAGVANDVGIRVVLDRVYK